MNKIRNKINDELITNVVRQPYHNLFHIAPEGDNMFALDYKGEIWHRVMYQRGIFNLVSALLMKQLIPMINEAQIYHGYVMRDTIRIPRKLTGPHSNLDWAQFVLPKLYVKHESRTLLISGWVYGFETAAYTRPGLAPYQAMKEGFDTLLEGQLSQLLSFD